MYTAHIPPKDNYDSVDICCELTVHMKVIHPGVCFQNVDGCIPTALIIHLWYFYEYIPFML